MPKTSKTVCLPCGVKRQGQTGPCFTKDELICYLQAIASLYGVAIDENLFNKTRDALWVAICAIMRKHHGAKATLWLGDKKVRDEVSKTCPLLAQTLLLQALLPVFRGDAATKWLPASNLVEIIHQRAPETLHFEGVVAADLRPATKDKHHAPLDIVNIRKNINNAKQWGMIMNIAVRSRPGEHWIALYSENPNHLEVYDSLGDRLCTKRTCGKSIHAIAGAKSGWTLREVATIHQTDDFMCGMYACYYILARAAGLSFETFQHKIVTHNEIEAFRAASINDIT